MLTSCVFVLIRPMTLDRNFLLRSEMTKWNLIK